MVDFITALLLHLTAVLLSGYFSACQKKYKVKGEAKLQPLSHLPEGLPGQGLSVCVAGSGARRLALLERPHSAWPGTGEGKDSTHS